MFRAFPGPCRPKIQRLVTPLRLQRRRHLRSLKRRRIERQKEQKTEYDALLAKRIAEKKEKVAAVKASHKKCVIPVSVSTLSLTAPRRLVLLQDHCVKRLSRVLSLSYAVARCMVLRIVMYFALLHLTPQSHTCDL